MPTFRCPPKLIIEIDPYAALQVAECLRLASKKGPVPTLGGVLDYFACTLREAVQGAVPRIRSEHLAEQSEAHLQEMLRGIDRIWEDTCADEPPGQEPRGHTPGPSSEPPNTQPPEQPPDDEWDPEHGEGWKGGKP
jgi:hypothetical protein